MGDPKTRWATREELEAELKRLKRIDHIPTIKMQICEIEATLKRMNELKTVRYETGRLVYIDAGSTLHLYGYNAWERFVRWLGGRIGLESFRHFREKILMDG